MENRREGTADMLNSIGCRPLLATYNSLIKCLLQEGFVEHAKSVIDLIYKP